MKRLSVTRRGMLLGAFGSGMGASFGRLPAFGQGAARLRMFWWGAQERAERTENVNKLFEKQNPGVSVIGESLGWTDYWPRLATEAAGRNTPDVLQMDYRYIFEYARRGALLPLDPFMPKTLRLQDFSQNAVDSGKVDGKIYGVSLGLNSTALVYDLTLIEQLGLKPPGLGATWQEIGDLAVAITNAAKRDGYAGIVQGAGYEPALEVWLRQRGKALYTGEGKLGFDAADAADWFGFWSDLGKRGGTVKADVQALDRGEIDSSLLTLGKAAITFAHSNQLVGFQALNKNRLGLSMYPAGGAGSKPGQYLKPAMLWSVAALTRKPDAAVKLVDFFANDLEAGKLLGVERGVPPSDAVRKEVTPTLDDLGRRMSDYVTLVTDKVGPLPPPPPQGAGEIEVLIGQVNEEIGFGRLSVADGAKQFVAQAAAILARG